MQISDNILSLLLAAAVLAALIVFGYKWLWHRIRVWRMLAHIKSGRLTVQNFPPDVLDSLSSKERAAVLAHLEARLAAPAGDLLIDQHQQAQSTTADWLVALFQANHLLITGTPHSGRRTFTHLLATTRAMTTARVIVWTPATQSGDWSHCEVYSVAQRAAFEQAVRSLRQELAARVSLHQNRGKQRFSPLHLVIDEYLSLVQLCPDLGVLVTEVLRRDEPLAIHLIISLSSKDAAAIEMHAQSPLRRRFTYILEVQGDGRQRWIRMTDGLSEQLVGIYPMPELEPVDPDDTLALSA